MSLIPKKMLKADYVSVINYHFSKQGKQIKNISKATLKNLKNLLTEYDIDLEKTYCEMMDIEKKEELEEAELKKEEEKEEAELKKEEDRMTNFIKKVMWFRRTQKIKQLYNNPNKQIYYMMFKLKQEEELNKQKQTALLMAMKINKGNGKIVQTGSITNIVYPHMTVNVYAGILTNYGNNWYNDIYNHLNTLLH